MEKGKEILKFRPKKNVESIGNILENFLKKKQR